ncbi:MAG TPA: MopE-related protein [Myxococcota bacterium]
MKPFVMCVVVVVVVVVVGGVACGGLDAPPGSPPSADQACVRASDCPQRACEEARCIDGACGYVVDATDVDGDGADCFREPFDCDPFDAAVSPLQIEQCGNGVDDNCDGVVDVDVDDPVACTVECRDGWCFDQAMRGGTIGVVDDGDDWQAFVAADFYVSSVHPITSAPIWRREGAGVWRSVDIARPAFEVDRIIAVAVDDVWVTGRGKVQHVVDNVVVAGIAVADQFVWASCVTDGEPWVIVRDDGWRLARLSNEGLHDAMRVAAHVIDRVPRLQCPGAGEVWIVADGRVERRTATGIARVTDLIDIVLIDVDEDGSVVAVDSALHAVRVRDDVVTAIDLATAEAALVDTIERFERAPDEHPTVREPRVLRDGMLVALTLPFPALARQALTTPAGRHVLIGDDGVLFSAP